MTATATDVNEQTIGTQQQTAGPTLKEQAGQVLLPLAAGYIGHRTVGIGLRQGLLETLADEAEGLTADELAEACDFDPFYVGVWCRAALASGVLERDETERYRLAPHIDTLLLDETSPAYAGALFTVMEQPEIFDWFEDRLATGERTWWDQASPGFIDDVSGSGRAFYTRLVPDGDEHSLKLARERAEEAGVDDRVAFIHTPLEELDPDDEFALVINNISMHECRDIDRVTANVHAALEPGGWFVISDFPFPETTEGLRTVPGRIMAGIQYWEAQIDDQLVPREYYDDLLARHGFGDIGSFEINPTHAVTYGRA